MTDKEWSHLWHVAFHSALRVLRSTQTAENIAQESIVALWQVCNSPDRRVVTNHASWIASAARYLALGALRRNREVVCDMSMFAAGSDKLEAHLTVTELLAEVPSPDRHLLVWHYIHCYSIADISEKTGLPCGTVKWRLHRARKRLRRALDCE